MKVRIWYDGGDYLYSIQYKWLHLFWRKVEYSPIFNTQEKAQAIIDKWKRDRIETIAVKKRRRELSKCVHEEVI